MTRLVGALLMVLALYAVLMGTFDFARSLDNHQVLARRLGFYGVLTLGVGILIVAGGIDLSIGSLVGLGAVLFGLLLARPIETTEAILFAVLIPLGPVVALRSFARAWLLGRGVGASAAAPLATGLAVVLAVGLTALGFFALRGQQLPTWLAALLVVWVSISIGLLHGLLITGLQLQPFLVTLCGLFMYRGLARWLSTSAIDLPTNRPEVAWLRSFLVSDTTLGVPHALWLLVLLAGLLALVLHGSIYGRYWFAIGYNEQAARYAGIAIDRYKIAAYTICSTLAGLGGILFLLEYRNATPSSAGQLLELYAITGAVLGGCSLRGGEGTVVGMVLGAAVLPILSQICTYSRYIGSDLEYTVIGAALLLATVGNELVTRLSRRN
jgi:ribose transport system permease protein